LVHLAAFISSSLAEVAGAFSPTGETTIPDTAFWSTVTLLRGQLGNEDNLSSWMFSHTLPSGSELIEQKTWDDKT